MEHEKFDLVFKGDVASGFDQTTAQKNMASLFKISDAKAEALFFGKPVTLKKGLDAETANKYRVAIKRAGAIVSVVASSVSEPQKESQNVNTQASSHSEPKQEGFELLSVGADVLRPEERKKDSVVAVETEHLSVKAQQGNLVEQGEIAQAEPVHVADLQASLADVGEELLKPEERQPSARKINAPDSITLAEAGEPLLEASKKETISPPNVDHISLDD